MKATKADVTLECEEREEVNFEVDDFYSSLDSGEGVIRFVLAFMLFLGAEGWNS